MSNVAGVRAAARDWIDADPDPDTRAELEALLAAGDDAELGERMGKNLEFGTAGLRGVMGAGSARMNRAVVIRTTRGVCNYLLQQGLETRPVIVGFDARANSRRFALDVIGVLLGAGLRVEYFEQPVPTPLVAYAARVRTAAAAVVITASHNPPEYNGYKLYGSRAIQLAPPDEIEVERQIQAVGKASDVPVLPLERAGERACAIGPLLFEQYLVELDALRSKPESVALRLAYTPLHGVGGPFAARAFEHAGYTDVHVVAAQAEPDPAFPTLRFPNPEEPGVLDRLRELGENEAVDLALANDPDADRLAVMVPGTDGALQALSGNQIGFLLADFVLTRAAPEPQPLLVCSVVSSPMFDAIAAEHGARCERTLTGFKWICTAAHELEQQGSLRFAFGCEEALGYTVGPLVRDKDGISAAVFFADLAAQLRAAGTSVRERLTALYERHGLWCSVQKNVVRPGNQGALDIARAMAQLRAEPPEILGLRRVVRITDYAQNSARRPRWLGASNLLGLDLEGESRVLVRPSGTEPKLKIYVDLRISLQHGDDPENREREAIAQARLLADAVAVGLGLA